MPERTIEVTARSTLRPAARSVTYVSGPEQTVTHLGKGLTAAGRRSLPARCCGTLESRVNRPPAAILLTPAFAAAGRSTAASQFARGCGPGRREPAVTPDADAAAKALGRAVPCRSQRDDDADPLLVRVSFATSRGGRACGAGPARREQVSARRRR
jgi:hypothetical protein